MSDQAALMAEETSRKRFVFVDALRGIAALMVLCHHMLFNPMLQTTLEGILPRAVCKFCALGVHGVEIFFVISGFVITHSMRNVAPTLGGAGRFILRRQLRLDPPYWAMLFLCILDVWVENHVPAFVHKPLPTRDGLLANLFYVQLILHKPQIVMVAWTLCLEIQFYLCFILMILIGGAAPTRPGGISRVTVAGVYALGIISMLCTGHQKIYAPNLLPFWSYFAAGVLCYWNFRRVIERRVFLSYLVAFAIATGWFLNDGMVVGCVTTVCLCIAGEAGALGHWLSNRVLQYFGRISYSLYLVHLLVVSAVIRGGYRLTHTNPWGALFWFVTAAVLSVLAAHLFHKVIEVPSLKVAAALRSKSARSPERPTSAAPVRCLASGAPAGMA
jgi:peptidoglycan/LPS O-acetylase OafA/YrhL